ncbi:hypothetical protein MFM001_38430 [Mycobacterium sp. MFM001]|uniref:SIMPL domain-containing protein n=1 Tax=Mycobacterium sp. MFM001 TaxID=2049453 RepID=UPI000DA4CD16|nr:SIMPL domain-containing protein [Mycobacterium sp. MFM001]GBE67381.1 hypothetical protein MFM001_38430 [Mycobacterium sp. MFM001]
MPLRLIAMLGLVVAALSACDGNPGPLKDNARQVTVVGNGQVQGVPDTLTADVAIEFVAPDVTSAMDQTNQRQQAVINALTGAGIDSKDISTTDVTLQPQYTGGGNTISGYRAANSIRVKIRKTDTASHVLAVIVDTGGDATRINSVSYSIEDDSKLVKDARARAFNDAKDRATQYAQLSGLSLGRVISISEASGSTPPTPTPLRGAPMATEAPLQPGQQTVSFSVTVAWELH